jgi:serine/threonine-protein kinase
MRWEGLEVGGTIASAVPTGTVFNGRYEVVCCLRAGGMGTVYEVVHLETRRRRALKVMLPSTVSDPDLRARFKLEATVTAEIDSEHIVEILDAGVDSATGSPFIVMELLKGSDLGAMSEHGPLPPKEVVSLLSQAALALDKTHAAGIVHRDLKPENLFVTIRDGGAPHLKILDFGIAKVVADRLECAKTTRNLGTPLYMAPEQMSGDRAIGPAADLYALALIAYTLLVGAPYWAEELRASGSVYAFMMKVMRGATESASVRAARAGAALPAAVDRWFSRAIAPRSRDRFPSASALTGALAEALGVEASPWPSCQDDALASRLASLADSEAAEIDGAVATPLPGPASRTTAGVQTTERPANAGARRAAPVVAASVLAGAILWGVVALRDSTRGTDVTPSNPTIDPSAQGPELSPAAREATAAPAPQPPPRAGDDSPPASSVVPPPRAPIVRARTSAPSAPRASGSAAGAPSPASARPRDPTREYY